MKTSIDKLPNIITEFVDNKLIPSSPGSMKWVLGGITYLVLNREQEILNKYLPTLTMLGLVEDNLIDTVGGLSGVLTTLGAILTKVFSNQLA